MRGIRLIYIGTILIVALGLTVPGVPLVGPASGHRQDCHQGATPIIYTAPRTCQMACEPDTNGEGIIQVQVFGKFMLIRASCGGVYTGCVIPIEGITCTEDDGWGMSHDDFGTCIREPKNLFIAGVTTDFDCVS